MKPYNFLKDENGNVLPTFAILSTLIIGTAGIAVDYSSQTNAQSKLQDIVDSSVLVAASNGGTDEENLERAREFFSVNVEKLPDFAKSKARSDFTITDNGTILGTANAEVPLLLGSLLAEGPLQVGVEAEAGVADNPERPCIHVLGNQPQAAVFNGGGNIIAPDCNIFVNSTSNNAVVLNNNTNIDTNRLCIASNNILNNGGFAPTLETGCETPPDPYAGTIPEPTIPSACDTQNLQLNISYTLQPGLHCNVTFQNTDTLTFAPGLHIISGTMILNPGTQVTAEDVTFYFPNTSSEIRSNGGHTMIATAPTSGTYEGILMFEKTSDPINNTQKRQYIFADQSNEILEGLMYLPNRDAVYNANTTIDTNNISLVVNTIILNPSNWSIEPVKGNINAGSGSESGSQGAYLIK